MRAAFRRLTTDFPETGRERFQHATDRINSSRAKIFAFLLIIFFSLYMIADLLYFVPRGRGYYLLYDIVMVVATAAFLVPHYQLRPGPLLRFLTAVFVYFMIIWGAFLSAMQGSAVTYLIILFVVAAVFYQRWFFALIMFSVGTGFYLVPLTLVSPEALDSVLLIEVVAASLWAWVVTRFLYRAHLVHYEQNRRIRSITRNQQKMIDERSRELALKVRERDILLGELNHRMKNNLQLLSSLLSLSLREGTQSPDGLVRETVNRIRSMAAVHEMLYAGDDLSAVELSSYLSRLIAEVVRSFDPGGRVNLEMEFEEIRVSTDTAVNLGLLINEILTNCFKHAFPPLLEGCRFRAILRRRPEGSLRLVTEDNGVGIEPAPAGRKEERPTGLLLLDALAAQVGGRVAVDSPVSGGRGTRITVEVTR